VVHIGEWLAGEHQTCSVQNPRRGMRRILFSWHGITIHSYPAMLYLGLVLGIVGGNYAANQAGLDSARAFIAMILLIIPALVGARLLFVATHWASFRDQLGRIWRRSEGGGALQGGLALMIAVSAPLLGVIGVPFGEFWDVAIFTLLSAMIFTRVGCLLNGCCSGKPCRTRLSLYLPDYRGVWQQRIPIQLLEAGLAALLLLGAIGFWNRRPFPGAIFVASVAIYSFGRFLLDPLREASDRIGALNVQQALSAALGVVALVGLLVGWLETT
jgi:phosphatidylglycerol:prolipoprotein diacylglycerol transferase